MRRTWHISEVFVFRQDKLQHVHLVVFDSSCLFRFVSRLNFVRADSVARIYRRWFLYHYAAFARVVYYSFFFRSWSDELFPAHPPGGISFSVIPDLISYRFRIRLPYPQCFISLATLSPFPLCPLCFFSDWWIAAIISDIRYLRLLVNISVNI